MVDLEGLNKGDWILQKAYESDGQIKYWVHGKVAVVVGDQKIPVQNEEERAVWFQVIQDLAEEGDIVLLDKRIGSLIYELV